MPGSPSPQANLVALLQQSAVRASGRSFPETPEEWLRASAIAVPLLLSAWLVGYLIRRYIFKREDRELSEVTSGSAAFHQRWTEPHIYQAPLNELRAEVHRCERIVILIDRRKTDRKKSAEEYLPHYESARAWLPALKAAMRFADQNRSSTSQGYPTSPD